MSRIAKKYCKRAPLLGLVAAAAMIALAGCVPSEDDFKDDHPAPGSNSGTSPSPNGSGLTCLATLTGTGTLGNPGQLGTAPVCFQFRSTTDTYYLVNVPATGTWFFQIVNMDGDDDIFVYSGSTFVTELGKSENSGNADDVVSLNINVTGIGGIRVKNFDGGNNFHRVEVVQ